MNDLDVFDRVKALDPAPRGQSFSEAEDETKQRLLTQILARDIDQPSGRSERVWPRIAVAAVSMGFVGSIALTAVFVGGPAPSAPVALGKGSMSGQALASWTNVPTPLEANNPVYQGCVTTLDTEPDTAGKPASIYVSDLRGEVGSVIVQQGEYVAWCVGTDNIPMFVLVGAPGFKQPSLQSGEITLGPSGGRIPPEGYGFATGRAGDGVTGVTLQEDGVDVVAALNNGWWSAWWPSDDESALLQGTITVMTTNGASITHKTSDLQTED